MTATAQTTPHRQCGACQLCCKLTPVGEIDKPANTRCAHQRFGKGCAIYADRPRGCRLWSCRWLLNDDSADLKRPDRAHYVIDVLPDFITATHNETGEAEHWPCVQIWVDPRHPTAHRDPALRAWLERKRTIALVRLGAGDGFVLVPPALNATGGWAELNGACDGAEHTAAEVAAVVWGTP